MRLSNLLNPLGLVTKAEVQERVNAARDEMREPSRSNQPAWQPYDADMRPGKLPYSVLRSYADGCEPVRLCINRIKTMLHTLDWKIGPVNEDEPDEAQLAEARDWFSMNGGIGRPGTMIDEFIDELTEDIIVCGAMALHPRPSQGRAVGLGGNYVSVEAIDAATIIPLRDGKGWQPEPPAPAFRQVLRDGKKLDFTREEILYRVWGARTTTAWGQSFVECCFMSVLQFQAADLYNLVWFTEGDSVLGYWRYTGGGELPTAELASFRAWLTKEKRRAQQKGKPLADITPPAGWEYTAFRPRSEADYIATEKFLFQRIAPFFGLSPTALGFETGTYKASQATLQEQAVTMASGPIAHFLEAVFTVILQVVLGLDQTKFEFDTDLVDLVKVANATNTVGTQRLTANEVRKLMGQPAIKGGYADDLYTVLPDGRVLVLGSTDPDRQIGATLQGVSGSADNKGNEIGNAGEVPAAESGAGGLAGAAAKSGPGSRADLLRWRGKVERHVARGKAAGEVPFQSEAIGEEVAKAIREELTAGVPIDEAFGPYLQREEAWAEDLGRGLDGLIAELEQQAVGKGAAL